MTTLVNLASGKYLKGWASKHKVSAKRFGKAVLPFGSLNLPLVLAMRFHPFLVIPSHYHNSSNIWATLPLSWGASELGGPSQAVGAHLISTCLALRIWTLEFKKLARTGGRGKICLFPFSAWIWCEGLIKFSPLVVLSKSMPSLGWLSRGWAPLHVSRQSCAMELMFSSDNGGEPLPFSGQNRVYQHISQDFIVKPWKNEPCHQGCMNEIPVCKYSGCRLPTLVYKLSYTTILMSAHAGKWQDWGHSQFTTPGSGMQTLSFPNSFCSKLGLARCHTLPVPMNFRGSTWQCAGLGSYHMKECLSICGTWISSLRAAKQSRSRLLTSLIRSASIWLTLPNICGHWPSRNSVWYNFCTESKLYALCGARIWAQFQFLRTTMYLPLLYVADDAFRTLIILERKTSYKKKGSNCLCTSFLSFKQSDSCRDQKYFWKAQIWCVRLRLSADLL